MLNRALPLAVCLAVAGPHAQGNTGRTFVSPGGAELRVLLDASGLGGSEVEVAELTLPPDSTSAEHRHGVTETFYLLEGQLTQVVNGKPIALSPGGLVSIRPTDRVVHRAGPKGAKVLVIWAPGGEIARVAGGWKTK